jgi:predicted SPOUT superfamily RNA methylase MTH1
MNPVLRLAGLLPPLDMHHHLRRTDEAPFREGVVVDAPPGHRPVFGQSEGCFANIGLDEPVFVNGQAEVGQRVTVRMADEREP